MNYGLPSLRGKLIGASLTGIQNQADDQLFPQFRREQFIHSIDALKAELRSLNEEINLDQQRAAITN